MLVVLLVINGAALLWLWRVDERMRQDRYVGTFAIIAGSSILALLWLVVLSPHRFKQKLMVLGVFVATSTTVTSVLRIQGVSGDFLPKVVWRWTHQPDHVLSSPASATPPKSARRDDTDLGISDYPQFLGPTRTATLKTIKLARDWSSRPPQKRWRRTVGAGWSSFAVVGRRALTQEQRGPKEMVVCYDLFDGQIQWTHTDQARYESIIAGIGPRATPTIYGKHVYTLGATGILNCLDLETGDCIWSRHILEDGAAQMNEWGMSGSPLVVDNFLVINAGGTEDASLLAYDRYCGKQIWSSGRDRASYASPMLVDLAGADQIIMLNQTSVTGHDPITGRILWHFPWSGTYPKVAQPLLLPNDRLFVTASYGVGCAIFRIQRTGSGSFEADPVWKSMALKAKFANAVYRDEHIYGIDDGVLVCLDISSGRRRWKAGRYGHGQIMLVDDLLLVQAESGDLALVEASPREFRELGQFPVLRGKTWNNPSLAGRYLLVRNHLEAACYELPEVEQGGVD